MRQSITIFTTAATLMALAAGCAGTGAASGSPPAPTGTPAQQAALTRYQAYAGPPIASMIWL